MTDKIIYFTGDYENDLEIMEGILDCVYFKSGTQRRKMYKQKEGTGGSMLFGLTWKSYLSPTKNRTKSEYKGLYYTKPVDEHPELREIFDEFAILHFPGFNYTQVQMNKNFKCGKHKDSSNVGESVLISIGKYKGGDTVVDYGDRIMRYDARKHPVKFNGAKYEHWVEDWTEGNRYSLVFFDNLKKRMKPVHHTEVISRRKSLSDLPDVGSPLLLDHDQV